MLPEQGVGTDEDGQRDEAGDQGLEEDHGVHRTTTSLRGAISHYAAGKALISEAITVIYI
jgi:hypothetical protein